jgi:putative oxidoreductase
MAVVAGVSEVTAGTLLVLGLLTPLASAIVIGTLVTAGSIHWAAGIWGQNGGYELPLVYVTAAAALAFTGPGDASLDNALGLDGFAGAWGVAAVVLGAVSGLVVVARARRTLAAEAAAAPVEPEPVPA